MKIAASGLCHTDWETMHGFQPINLPAIIGHERAGVVDAVGPGVTRVKVGDHVVCSWSPNCGHCFYCDQGQPILCETAREANANEVLFDGTTRMSRNGERSTTTASSLRTPSITLFRNRPRCPYPKISRSTAPRCWAAP